jgi:restriction system protein
MTNAWVVRAGRIGEREQFNLEHTFAGGGFGQAGDLSGCMSSEDIRAQVHSAHTGAKSGRLANYELARVESGLWLGNTERPCRA